jgi:3-dehydro-L-gulonate 2-dehydrogenase
MPLRVSYDELSDTLAGGLAAIGVEPDRARLCARLIADSTRDGVASHGLNLFPRVVTMIRQGRIDIRARATRVAVHGSLERWDGHCGIGALNAYAAMDAAIARSRTHGIGCVALFNTTHWMRGGTYGWQAADAGVIGLCWTNTMPNLPPWGADTPRIGNNPLVIAVPRAGGHVVLDMAMSQFSYGALAGFRARGEPLPVPGGFDREGHLTQDAAAIEASHRPLPIGFWKGSGLSILLDLVAAMLSGGRATHEIPADPEQEIGLSQLFVAFDPSGFPGADGSRIADGVIDSLQARYPGERTLETRARNLREGIEVDEAAWRFAQECAGGSRP